MKIREEAKNGECLDKAVIRPGWHVEGVERAEGKPRASASQNEKAPSCCGKSYQTQRRVLCGEVI